MVGVSGDRCAGRASRAQRQGPLLARAKYQRERVVVGDHVREELDHASSPGLVMGTIGEARAELSACIAPRKAHEPELRLWCGHGKKVSHGCSNVFMGVTSSDTPPSHNGS